MNVLYCLLIVAQGSILKFDMESKDFTIIRSGIVNPVWNPDYSEGFTCHPVLQFTERVSQDSREFLFKNNDKELAHIEAPIVYAVAGGVLDPTLTITSHEFRKGNLTTLTVDYNCREDPAEVPWSIVQLKFTIRAEEYTIKYIKMCKNTISPFDWSTVLLMLVAIGVVGLSAYSVTFITEDEIIPEGDSQLTVYHAIGFVICGSIVLITLFFLLAYITMLLTILIAVGAVVSMTYALAVICPCHSQRAIHFPVFGTVNIVTVVNLFISFLVVSFYIYSKNWLLNNLIGVCYCLLVIRSFKVPSLKVGSLLLGLAFLYDVFWVFYSSYIFGGNVMVAVATGLDLPVKLQCPKLQEFPTDYTCGLIGLGDLVLPGLLVAFAVRWDSVNNSSYFWTQISAYIIALGCCGAALTVFEVAQPALLYISPLLCASMLLHSILRSEFKRIWCGAMSAEDAPSIALTAIAYARIEDDG